MIKLKDNHQLLEKIVSKPEKGLAQLQTYLKLLLDNDMIQPIQSVASYFIFRSAHPNQNLQYKLGVIQGLQAITYILRQKQALKMYISQMVAPILSYFHDSNQKVRYVGISSVYNIFTALGDDCLQIFTKTFNELIFIIIDNSSDVRLAAGHLNHTMQTLLNDAILDHKVFDIKGFIMVINQNFVMKNPLIKQFLIGWINTLDQICEFEVSFYLPDLLQELLFLLIHDSKNVKTKSEQCLKGFLHGFRQIQRSENLDITKKLTKNDAEKIIQILLQVLKQSFSSEINIHALQWIQAFSQFLQKEQTNKNKAFFLPLFLSKFQNILYIVLKMISNQNQIVRKLAISINKKLLLVVTSKTAKQIDPDTVLMLPFILKQSKSPSKIQAVIKWITFLLRESNQTILFQINTVIQRIIEKICQKNGKNVVELLQNSIFTERYFELLIQTLLLFFYEYPYLQIDLILRRVINLSDPNLNFLIVCQKLNSFQRNPFRFKILDHLVSILITQDSLRSLRQQIKTSIDFCESKQYSKQADTFNKLFPVFCSNQAALITLCFLAKRYHLICELFHQFSSQGSITYVKISSFLKLVNLFESPNMDFIRVEIMNQSRSFILRKAYLSLIMTLPPGKLNRVLMKRLDVIALSNDEDSDEEYQTNQEQPQKNNYEIKQKQFVTKHIQIYQQIRECMNKRRQ